MRCLELIFSLMKCKKNEVFENLVESDFFAILITLIEKYEWNNILHNLIEKIITFDEKHMFK